MKVRIKEIIRPTGDVVYKIQRRYCGLFWVNEKFKYVYEYNNDYKYVYSIKEIVTKSKEYAKLYAEWISQGKNYVIGETPNGYGAFLYKYCSSNKDGTYYVGDEDFDKAKETIQKFINKKQKVEINIINI